MADVSPTDPGSMTSAVRTRFAPSPTGNMHVGNLRIAIFNYLFARKHRGVFLLRVEDTDVARNLKGSLDRLLEDLRWAGIEWDEGPDIGGPFVPYVQSQRNERHMEKALDLEKRGLAYRCFCTNAEIEAVRTEGGNSPRCPGGCRTLDPDDAKERERHESSAAAIRFAVPDGDIEVKDHIRGLISFHSRDMGDFVILRTDGRSTYNFAVVVDDVDMEITHVIRGAGHLSNTPKQALLFDALGSTRPVFAHLPTVLGPDGSRLSKRTGSPGIDRLRAEGFHPDAVVNYLSLLGWSPGNNREIMSRSEIVRSLDLDRVRPSNTVYDLEKMRWISAQHIASMPTEELASAVGPYIDHEEFPQERVNLLPAIEAVRSRLHTFSQINSALRILFPDTDTLQTARRELAEDPEAALRVLRAVRDRLETLNPWTAEDAARAVREAGQELEVNGPSLFHPVRLALCGARSGPDLGKVLAALGRQRVLLRLSEAGGSVEAGF